MTNFLTDTNAMIANTMTIKSFTISPNKFLSQSVQGYYHELYYSGNGEWAQKDRFEYIIGTLKNDKRSQPQAALDDVCKRMRKILRNDLPQIREKHGNLLVCSVPRSKTEDCYKPNQLLFREVVGEMAREIAGLSDGKPYLTRVKNTKTTHQRWCRNRGGDGLGPYPGITKDTCEISDEVIGQDILLIDDLYTNSVNIIEDVIEALYDKGARMVIHYSLGGKFK